MKRLATITITAVLIAVAAIAEEPATKPYDAGFSLLSFTYPREFTLDPKSHQGEAKWWARMTSPDGTLSIEVMSHGYCSDRLHTVEGYKSPEDYVLRALVGEQAVRTKLKNCDRLVAADSASVNVVFLRHGSDWGRCYQELRFQFAKDSYPRWKAVIDAVIQSAQPTFEKDLP